MQDVPEIGLIKETIYACCHTEIFSAFDFK